MIENPQLLGKNVAYLVDDLKIASRADLADAMGVSVSAVGQIIRNESKGLKPLNLVKAAKRLGVGIEDLVIEDLRSKPELLGRALTKGPSISEPGVHYGDSVTVRVQVLLHRIYVAAVQNRLNTSALEYLERTVDMLIPG